MEQQHCYKHMEADNSTSTFYCSWSENSKKTRCNEYNRYMPILYQGGRVNKGRRTMGEPWKGH
eukprot:15351144-Ditylum_brightwellii.AAC.1